MRWGGWWILRRGSAAEGNIARVNEQSRLGQCLFVEQAQTDYYNTDAGRPITVEDAYPTERYAFELQLAPVRMEGARGGVYTCSVEPGIACGPNLLPAPWRRRF